jgi:hypothetical protein
MQSCQPGSLALFLLDTLHAGGNVDDDTSYPLQQLDQICGNCLFVNIAAESGFELYVPGE